MSFSRYLNCLSGVHYNISCSVVIIVMMEHCVRVAVTPASNLEGPSFKSQIEDFFLNYILNYYPQSRHSVLH